MKVDNYSDELSDVKICSGVYFADERGILKKSIHGENCLIQLKISVKIYIKIFQN